MPVTAVSLVIMLFGSLVYAGGVRRSNRGLRVLGTALIFVVPVGYTLYWVAAALHGGD